VCLGVKLTSLSALRVNFPPYADRGMEHASASESGRIDEVGESAAGGLRTSCRRRSANRDDDGRINLAEGRRLAARHVDRYDFPGERIETIHRVAHRRYAGKPKDGGCNPGGLSGFGVDLIDRAGKDGGDRKGRDVDTKTIKYCVEFAPVAEQVRIEDVD